ncbi:hypothetical protein LEN26_008271 [Aphanomyces euteiches]|nr:hypothetical protein AeMF1_004135 [Aphanomyces euteiches]KAH9130709.1 hypothetical protein LEN26_008271 [Aphanomyces euteiches]KAH9188823.1 hypothetical protein AeNC1_009202 [Aphanomyces euteiches]
MLSSVRHIATRSSKYSKLAFPRLVAGTHVPPTMQFPMMHVHAFSTTSREKELEAENKKLKEEIAALQKKVDKKGFIAMVKENGLPFVLWWVTLYVGGGVGIYAALEAGYVGGGDAIHLLQSLGLDQYYDTKTINPTYGNAAVAIILNEFLEAIRLPLVIATTPMIKRTFQKKAVENK